MSQSTNKALLATVSILVVSLGVNAWQFAQRSRGDAGAGRDQSAKASAGRSAGSGEGGDAQGSEAGSKAGRDRAPANAATGKSLQEILAMRDPMERYEALLAFVKNLPADLIGETLEELRAGSGKLDAEARLIAHLLLTRWGQEDAEAAFASLGSVNIKQGGGDAMAILAGLAATDPARAVSWLTDPENAMSQQPWMGHMLARTIGEEWARQDPDAALAWAASLTDGEQRGGAYTGIIRNILDTDPERAAAVALQLDPADRSKIVGEIAETWARQNPDAAVAWANALEGVARAEALPDALGGWAQVEPSAAASFVDGLPEAERSAHVSSVARTWSDHEPAEAANWLGTQPESRGKADAMGHVMWDWTNADPEAAANWLGEQPAGQSYDNGVAGLAKASAHVYEDAGTSVEWASTIEDQNLRERMVNHSLDQWMRQDPDAARSWATQNGVDVPASRGGK